MLTLATLTIIALCVFSVADAHLFYVEEAEPELGRRYRLEACHQALDTPTPTVESCLSVKTVAVAEYNKTLNETGWDYLYLRPSPMFNRPGLSVQAQAEGYRAVGYLEGYLTADRMWSRYSLTIGPSSAQIMSFIGQHMSYMQSLFQTSHVGSIATPPPPPPHPPQAPSGFLDQLQKVWLQLEGLHEGYNDFVADQGEGTKMERMTLDQIFVLSYQPEMGDVQNYLDAMEMNSTAAGSGTSGTLLSTQSAIRSARGRLTGKLLRATPGTNDGAFGGEHCSGFVKPTVDENGELTDLFASQASWFWFTAMWRQYKIYDMDVGTVALSSYPGALVSQDDWYATSHGLATLETTIASSNLTNYLDGRFGPQAVSEWLRCMIANYLAKSAPEWATLFSYLNSGSYNNQWMIVDMKLFPEGKTLQDLPNNLMWLCETLPGIALCDDVTSVLRQQGYWASYNIPYFPEIYVNSGYAASEQQFGSFFSYTKYCRAQIFKRNHTLVTDLESMRALMRYNDFQNDPMSDIPNCTGTIYNNTCKPMRSAMLSVAARGDLDPPLNASVAGPLAALGWIGQQNVAAVDCKIASWSAMMKGGSSSRPGIRRIKATAISGPTAYQQPVFQFSTAPEPLRGLMQAHLQEGGLPDRWDFPWQEYDAAASPAEEHWERVAARSFRGRVRLESNTSAMTVDPFYMTFGDNSTLAIIEYNATMNQTGWDVVTVTANPDVLKVNATLAYYGAGYLEGYATAPSILENYLNYQVAGFFTDPAFAPESAFVREQLSNTRCLAAGECTPRQAPPPNPKYLNQLGNLLAQLQGLTDGYNTFVLAAIAQSKAKNITATTPSAIPLRTLTQDELYLISYFPEMPDVDTWAATNAQHPKSESWRERSWQRKSNRPSHCSALIKPVGHDLFAAQATWANYNFMLRQYKSYVFEAAVSFSSYPGMLQSADDWYITSNGLTVMETSNNVFNTALYVSTNFNTSNVPSWLRVMTAMHLATTAQEWQQIFVYLNSGSYNNQWMAVDMKLFTPGTALSQLPDNLVWVSETLPGFYQMADVTAVLRQQGYWASYNIPYFPEIYALSGNLGMELSYGSFFSYTKYARPEIFKRNHTMVTDLESMKALMRYNDFQNDPLSDIPNCTGTIYNNTCKPVRSAMLSVAARGDLDPVGNSSTMGPLAGLGLIGQQGMGAIDCKIASAVQSFSTSPSQPLSPSGRQQLTLSGFVISGPTSQQQKPFQWSTAPALVTANVTWYGQPDLFNFAWQSIATPLHGFPLPSGQGQLVAPPNPVIGIAIGLGVSLLIISLGIMVFSVRAVSGTSSPDGPSGESTKLLPSQVQ